MNQGASASLDVTDKAEEDEQRLLAQVSSVNLGTDGEDRSRLACRQFFTGILEDRERGFAVGERQGAGYPGKAGNDSGGAGITSGYGPAAAVSQGQERAVTAASLFPVHGLFTRCSPRRALSLPGLMSRAAWYSSAAR